LRDDRVIDKYELDVDDLLESFEELEDPRSQTNRKHPLPSVLMIAVMGVLAGNGGPTRIAAWANYKTEWLHSILDLPHGIPRKDVFRRVLIALNPELFQRCFHAWISGLAEDARQSTGVGRPVFSVDGKTSRRSHDQAKGVKALHAVSVWAGDYGLGHGLSADRMIRPYESGMLWMVRSLTVCEGMKIGF